MSKILIIAEKHELAKAIVTAIMPNAKKNNNYWEDDKYYCVSAIGHLLEFTDTKILNPNDNRNDINLLPVYYENWSKTPIEDKKDRVKLINELLAKSSEVINAGDPDDEGQLLIDELLEYFNYQKPVKRVLINDNLSIKIQEAFSRLKPNEDFIGISNSAYARQLADLVFGINETRLASIELKSYLPLGRVQTPTLGLVVNRDNEIEHHIKQKYITLFGDFKCNDLNFKAEFVPSDTLKQHLNIIENKYVSEDNIDIYEQIQNEIKDKIYTFDVNKSIKKENPPLPFNLTELQSYLNNKYGFTADKTLKITQSLRDNFQAITYNRTDCRYLAEEHFDEAENVLSTAMSNIGENFDLDYKIKSKCFDNSKISAHHGIIPQNKIIDINKLSNDEQKVYIAIVERYAMQFMNPVIKEVITLTTKLSKGNLKSKIVNIIDFGYKLQMEKEVLEQDNVNINVQELNATNIDTKIKINETSPKKAYNEGTLLKDMSSISKYCSKDIKEILLSKDEGKEGENGGIGTSATRSSIIESLVNRGYLERKGKNIISTDRGKNLISILPDDMKTPDMTAKWWLLQQKIANNELSRDAIAKSVLENFNNRKNEHYYKNIDNSLFCIEKKVYGKCPVCGSNILKGKKENYYCENYKNCNFAGIFPSVKYFDNTIKMTDARVKKLLEHKSIKVDVKGKYGVYKTDLIMSLNDYDEKVYFNLIKKNNL